MTALELLDIREVGREAWLDARKLGSSDAAAICGLNKWRTPYQVWAEKTGVAAPVEQNEAMRWGNLLEPVIAAEFGDRTGLMPRKNDKLFCSAGHDYLTATPDYFVMEEGVQGLVECKNTSVYQASDWEAGIPDAAHIQVMHQLAVTGLTYAYVVGLVGGNKLVWHRIERDEAIIHALISKLEAFWELVQTKTPPPLSSGDSDTMNEVYPYSSAAKQVTLPHAYESLCEAYLAAKMREKEAIERAQTIAAQIKAELADAERATVGKYKITWKSQKKRGHWTKESESRPFLLSEIKEAK